MSTSVSDNNQRPVFALKRAFGTRRSTSGRRPERSLEDCALRVSYAPHCCRLGACSSYHPLSASSDAVSTGTTEKSVGKLYTFSPLMHVDLHSMLKSWMIHTWRGNCFHLDAGQFLSGRVIRTPANTPVY